MAFLGNITGNGLFLSLVFGFLPPLFWLWFWLREDARPEPRSLIFLVFIYGMVAAVLSIPVEYFVKLFTENIIILLLSWSFIEEIFKYLAASKGGLLKKAFDEPIDALVYMTTAALGFASAENVLFLLKAVGTSGTIATVVTGNLRFLGATLLHVVASSILGASIAYAFFHKEKMIRNVLGGLILSTALHFSFNFLILKSEPNDILRIFIPLWVFIIAVIFLYEKIKNIKK